ncbi:polyprenyl synthetase family protein [Poriferisphaera sp. WC338]|uniref:polyprenyl synthetase family protein n=1 Tax=Poriferisphaera sp. WC338 TaxID=3425129 RepID=UPI003D815EED
MAQQDSELSERLAADLIDVERRFASELQSDLACVNDLVNHIERYRGKMLRPTLVLVTAMACVSTDGFPVNDSHRIVATVTEMVHMATLVHDDILDEAEMRRRGQTINNLSGNEAAVMLGDYLISHAYHLCSSIPDSDVSRMIADATNTVCEGELLQLHNRKNFNLTEQTYYDIIRRKTASLCGICCKLAAYLSKAQPHTADALYSYGEKLGIAFQIVDDVLDLLGDEQTVGKSLGRDLEKSKLTLPLIHYLNTADEADRNVMLSLLDQQRQTDLPEQTRHEQVGIIAGRLRQFGSVDYARDKAASLVEQAKLVVTEHLPESPAASLLISMADAVLSREF